MGALSGRVPKVTYLTKETLKRIDAARTDRGQTYQAFTHEAIFDLLERCEDDRERGEERRREKKRRAPQGLGIRDRLQQGAEPADASDEQVAMQQTPSATPPVTVNVNQTAGAGSTLDLSDTAKMIAAVPASSRRSVLEKAGEAIARVAKSREEAEALIDKLDAEIKRIEGRPAATALERVRARAKK